ncbi:FAD-dependent thymidylate synthase [Streptomyces sp. CB03238]|uniref:FAD-dependent thymidylate synthase n=1 Tax=Streptomyces sp. CB03238 TaxID=1907777 RepID=UPI001F4D6EF9|nr:FAD-dependent thymidylate synthase [Streptomyces sp. CB03238]
MPTPVTPTVRIISRPNLDRDELDRYLAEIGGQDWTAQRTEYNDTQDLVEVAGRTCYRSWAPGLNPNVTRVRTDPDAYLGNIVAHRHGSVLEHAQYTFVLQNVSRVFTHEWVRHRQGVAISQESLRYVRLTDLPFWYPEWAQNDADLVSRGQQVLTALEDFQAWMADHFQLDAPGVLFHEKKAKTSFMRRFAPEGLATVLVWSANIRTLRHVVESRTDEGAEEEVRLVANQIGELMATEVPALFADYVIDDTGAWLTTNRKV